MAGLVVCYSPPSQKKHSFLTFQMVWCPVTHHSEDVGQIRHLPQQKHSKQFLVQGPLE